MKLPEEYRNKFLIIADGACMKNPGPGGYGTIMVSPNQFVYEFGGGEAETTNNRMELMGFYRGLQEVYKFSRKNKTESKPKQIIRAILDSMYVIDGSKKYVWNWVKNGWRTQTGEVKNQDIWEKILKGLILLREEGFIMEYEHVKGHSGHDANERVDQIAVFFARKFSGASESVPELYSGSLEDYSLDLSATPFEVTYLSYVDGVLKRHVTWSECESFVKGKTSAKFKKVTNRLQQEEVLKEWGVPTEMR